MRKLIISEFITLDGVIQAPGGQDEDLDGGFQHGGWVPPLWDDGIGVAFDEVMSNVDAFLLGRRTYVGHALAFEPMPAGDPIGDLMNAPHHYVVSQTLTQPLWRNTTIIRERVIETVRDLKAQPGRDILLDGSSQLAHALFAHDLVDEIHLVTFPLILGSGKRLFPDGTRATFKLAASRSLPNGVVILRYAREAAAPAP